MLPPLYTSRQSQHCPLQRLASTSSTDTHARKQYDCTTGSWQWLGITPCPGPRSGGGRPSGSRKPSRESSASASATVAQASSTDMQPIPQHQDPIFDAAVPQDDLSPQAVGVGEDLEQSTWDEDCQGIPDQPEAQDYPPFDIPAAAAARRQVQATLAVVEEGEEGAACRLVVGPPLQEHANTDSGMAAHVDPAPSASQTPAAAAGAGEAKAGKLVCELLEPDRDWRYLKNSAREQSRAFGASDAAEPCDGGLQAQVHPLLCSLDEYLAAPASDGASDHLSSDSSELDDSPKSTTAGSACLDAFDYDPMSPLSRYPEPVDPFATLHTTGLLADEDGGTTCTPAEDGSTVENTNVAAPVRPLVSEVLDAFLRMRGGDWENGAHAFIYISLQLHCPLCGCSLASFRECAMRSAHPTQETCII